ncbi:hypothetical protein GTH32_05430 [Alteromonas sp. 345S023]|uniref:Uncharacterized protein n=1 Tax=Alteromonas profundi TaxID=2696062 RepID=A0A7X5LJT5_9ALTE|nr:hypothetical protein [Alteromonas profundi]NDV90638.1 hypothetical protein [Alteromonas profundi]
MNGEKVAMRYLGSGSSLKQNYPERDDFTHPSENFTRYHFNIYLPYLPTHNVQVSV